MEYAQAKEIILHFLNSGCEKLNINGCQKLHKDYMEAVNAPGCTACARRRARNKYGNILKEALYQEKHKNAADFWKDPKDAKEL